MNQSSRPRNALAESNAAPAEPAPEGSVFRLVAAWLRGTLGKGDASLKEAIEEVLEEHEEETATLAPEEKVMLKNMLTFGELTVSDIMIPRTDVAAVPHTVSLDALKQHIVEQRHTRIPVYEETLDHVKGFVHVKDLVPMLSSDVPYDLSALTRHVLFVPPSMRIVDLLLKMRLAGVHMAIVVDEYGGTDGLVTLEDLFEEIVGEIQDEHDEVEDNEKLTVVSDRVIDVDARIRIEKLMEELGLDLVKEAQEAGFDTLAGLISFETGRVPGIGETVEHPSGTRFEILDADALRIRKVRLHLPEPADAAEQGEG